jgi:hypothetical protein
MRITDIIKRMIIGRLILSFVIVFTFFGVIIEIGYAMHATVEISNDWKEILLLLLGALIGAFGRVIDYWFNDSGKDKQLINNSMKEDSTL